MWGAWSHDAGRVGIRLNGVHLISVCVCVGGGGGGGGAVLVMAEARIQNWPQNRSSTLSVN